VTREVTREATREDAAQIALVRAAQRGDITSFEKLYRHYYQKVYVVARATLKDSHEAEDILQQTFVTAWKKLNTLQQPAAFPAWITRIAVNACYSLLRNRNIPLPVDANEDMFEQEDLDEETMPAVYAERADLRERLAQVIESLSDLQRQAIAMYYFEGLKVEEIANATGSTANTVKVRLHAARKAIKERIIVEEKKSGERFWGVTGVPLVALSATLASQFASVGADAGSPDGLLEELRASLSGASDGTAGAYGASGTVGFEGAAGGGGAVGSEGAVSSDGFEGSGGSANSEGTVTSEAAWEEIAGIKQRLKELEEEDANLAELQAHIDNHASELVQMVGNWKSSFGDMESILMSSRVGGSYAELMDEAFDGGDYQLMCAHIDDFRARVQACRQQVQTDMVDCRERLRLAEMRFHRLENTMSTGGLEA
jgi:RNA polymerase sigma-70 factor (ECF subfamily)